MKKLLALSLISVSLFGCSNQVNQTIIPIQEQNTAISSNSSPWGDLIDTKTNGLKKEATTKRLTGNTITVKSDDINHDKNALLVYFSKGELTTGSHFHLVMDIKVNDDQYGKRGDSWIAVESSYFSGLTLTKAEAAKILKSSTNYSKYASQLDKIFK